MNEEKIRIAIDGKKYFELNENLKSFIKYVCPEITSLNNIRCHKIAGHNKCDLEIIIRNKAYKVSVKKGKANSVHQEPIESFIDFLENTYGISESLANDLRFFIWGDETLNGNGKKVDRKNATQLKKIYPDRIKNIHIFFENNKEDLIRRFLLTGVDGDSIDFIYYGDEIDGLWANKQTVSSIASDSSKNSRAVIPIGDLTFQAWNRALAKNTKSEHKRGQIQLKWGSLSKRLKKIKNERR